MLLTKTIRTVENTEQFQSIPIKAALKQLPT